MECECKVWKGGEGRDKDEEKKSNEASVVYGVKLDFMEQRFEV